MLGINLIRFYVGFAADDFVDDEDFGAVLERHRGEAIPHGGYNAGPGPGTIAAQDQARRIRELEAQNAALKEQLKRANRRKRPRTSSKSSGKGKGKGKLRQIPEDDEDV